MNRLQTIIQHLLIKYHHGVISDNFDILRHVIEGHIVVEGKVFRYNDNIKSDVIDEIKEHTEQHKEFLQKVIDLEPDLKEHFQSYDHLHIHKL